MLNDLSSPLSLLETRRSARPRELAGEGPSREELDRMLAIAARTPDHGKLEPWRFVLVPAECRDAFAALLRDALADEGPGSTEAHRNKEEEFANYSGALVVLVSAPVREHKVPVWEQELSCGAVGMNLLHAAHAMGFVAGWLTGWRAYAPRVRDAFCAEGERIAGFFFIGRTPCDIVERPRPDLGRVVRTWEPPE